MSRLLPEILYAGDKLVFTESESDYLASDGWTLKYDIIHPTATKITLVSVADGDNHKFTITSATSAGYTVGEYRYVRYADDGTTEEHLDRGIVNVKPDFVALANYDFRTHARTTLEALKAAIERRATKEQASIAIGVRGSSRQLQYLTLDELIRAKDYYQGLVNREDQQDLIDQGKQPGNKNLIQFTNP